MTFILILSLIVAVLGVFYWLKNRGRKKVARADHEYFSRLWLWPEGEHTRWEAELDIESELVGGTVGLHAEDNYEYSESPEPTVEEIEFAKHYLANLELLFEVSRSGVRQGWREWFDEDLPEHWTREFVVDGFSVPCNGEAAGRWGITLFCEKAGHYFCLAVENGASKLESIDG